MPWTGRDALLARWLARFASRHALEASIDKYLKSSYAYDDQRADAWVQRDHVRDQELAALGDPENTLIGPSRYDLNDCYHCYGRGYVRLDVDAGHSDFGRARVCPVCRNQNDTAQHCAKCTAFAAVQRDNPERNQCWHCRRFEDESAGESCTNPSWHLPNMNLPRPTPPPGWHHLGSTLA